jgi:hypothetical protein
MAKGRKQLDRRDFPSLEQRGKLMNGAGDQSFRHGTFQSALK